VVERLDLASRRPLTRPVSHGRSSRFEGLSYGEYVCIGARVQCRTVLGRCGSKVKRSDFFLSMSKNF
jgi:hypothetical protein